MSISRRKRFEVFRRDGYACHYCGRRAPAVTLEVDHKIPRCKGGSDHLSNLVSACWDCNRGKGPLDAEAREEPDPVEEDCRVIDELYRYWNGPEPRDGRGTQDQASDFIPDWMKQRTRKPIVFDFDVYAAAGQIAKPSIVTVLTPEAFDFKSGLF